MARILDHLANLESLEKEEVRDRVWCCAGGARELLLPLAEPIEVLFGVFSVGFGQLFDNERIGWLASVDCHLFLDCLDDLAATIRAVSFTDDHGGPTARVLADA